MEITSINLDAGEHIASAGSNILIVTDINMKGSKVSVIVAQAAENMAKGIKYVSDQIDKGLGHQNKRLYEMMVV